MQAFKSAGLKVPDNIAMTEFTNDAISTIIDPHLTTINYSGLHMGEIAAKLLLDQLTGEADIHLVNTIIMNAN